MWALHEIRTKKKLSLRKLSRKSGVGVTTLVRLEAGEFDPRMATTQKLARALGVPVGNLTEDVRGRKKGDKEMDWAKEATEATRAAKRDFAAMWNRHRNRLTEAIYAYDFEELELIYKLFQLKLRNQQTSGY